MAVKKSRGGGTTSAGADGVDRGVNDLSPRSSVSDGSRSDDSSSIGSTAVSVVASAAAVAAAAAAPSSSHGASSYGDLRGLGYQSSAVYVNRTTSSVSSSEEGSMHQYSSIPSESGSDASANYHDLSAVPSEVLHGQSKPSQGHHHHHHHHHHRVPSERKKSKKKEKGRRSDGGNGSASSQSTPSPPVSARKSKAARERTGSSNGDLPPNYADLPNVAHVVASPANARAGVSNGQYLTGVPGADRARGSSRDNHSDSQDSKSEYADLTVASEFPASVRSSQQYPRPASVKSHSSADDGDDRSANYFEFGGIPSELHQGSPARSSSQQLPGGRAVTSTASSRSGDGERVSTDLPDLVDENESKKQYFDITSGIPSESSHSSSPKSPATAAAATAAPASDSPAQYFDVSQVPIAQESPRTARAMKGKKDGKKSRRKTKDSGSRSGSAEMVAADPQSTSPLAPAPDVANPSAEQPSPLPFNGKDSWMSWGASLSSSTDNIHSPDHCSPYSSRRESNSAFVAPVLSEYVEVDEAIDIANRRASALAYANSCANGAASPASVDDPAFDTPRDILPDPNLALMSRRHTLANSSSGMASPMVHRSQTPLVQSTRMSAGAAAVARTSSGQPRSSTDSSASAGEQSFGQTSLPRSSRESLSGGGSAISRPDSCLSSPSEFWCALLGDRDDQSVSIDFFRSALTRRFGHSTTAPFIDLVKAIFSNSVPRQPLCMLAAWCHVRELPADLDNVLRFFSTPWFYPMMGKEESRKWLTLFASPSVPVFLARFDDLKYFRSVVISVEHPTGGAMDFKLVASESSFRFTVLKPEGRVDVSSLGEAISRVLAPNAFPLAMEIASSPCFHHTMTMNSASGMLVNYEPRTIAVRFGTSGGLTLSACSRVSGTTRQVIHIRLQVTRDGVITEVETGRVFANFRQMLAENDFRPCMINPNPNGLIADVCRQWS